jgi:hypothetical protein
LIDKLEPNFSHVFNGIVWNTVASNDEKILLVEVRKPEEKRVLFSAFNYETNLFLWHDRQLEEPWWVNASAIVQGMVFFTIYLDTNNPDKKGILAYSLKELQLVWWNNDFSVSEISALGIKGFSGKFGLRELILNIMDGGEIKELRQGDFPRQDIKKPVQYTEGMQYFETVKTFLLNQLNLQAVSALEYMETNNCFLISCYTSAGENLLANFLLVYSKGGKLLLQEQLDSRLNGIGLDTFFIIDGLLFFVKNKVELVSFRIL